MKQKRSLLAIVLALAMLLSTVSPVLAVGGDTKGTVSITQETVDESQGIYKLVMKAQSNVANLSTAAISISFDNTVIQPVKASSGHTTVEITDQSTNSDAFTTACSFVDFETPYFSKVGAKWVVEGVRSAFTISMQSSDNVNGTPVTEEKTIAEFYFSIKEGQTPAKGTFRLETPDAKDSLLSRLFSTESEQNAVFLGTKSSENYMYYGSKTYQDNLAVTLTYNGMDVQKLGSLELGTVSGINVSVDKQTSAAPTVTAKDTEGDAMATPALIWTYDPSSAPVGVTYNNDGTITVDKTAQSCNVKVTASSGGVKSNEVTISVTRADPVLTSVVLDKPTVQVDGESGDQTVTATAYDQFGERVNGSVIWSISGPDTSNVSMVGSEVQIKSVAKAGTYTVKAEKDGANDTAPLTITRADAKARTVTVTIPSGSQTVTVPALDESAVTVQPTVTVKDQYGDTIQKPVLTWTLETALNGVSINQTTGEITIDPAAAAGKVTVKATCDSASGTADITLGRAESEVTTVVLKRGDKTLESTDTLTIPAKDTSEYTYTAEVLDQYGAPITGKTVTWTFTTEGNGVSFAEGKVTVSSTATADATYTLKAEAEGKSATVTITVKAIEIKWPTVTVREGVTPTYGMTWGDILSVAEDGSANIAGTPVEGDFTIVGADTYPDAGTQKYSLTFTSNDDDYVITEEIANVEVARKTITITGVEATDRAYNQGTDVVITGGTLVGVLANDTVTAVVPQTGTVASPNAGSNLAVTLNEITLSGADAANYTLTQPTGITVNISKADITSLSVTSVADVTVLASTVNSIEDVKDQITEKTATATFGGSLTEEVTINWTTSDSFAAGTDKTYTFTGTVGTDNLDGSGLNALTAKVNVTVKFPVDVTVTAPANIIYGQEVGNPSAQQVEMKPEFGTDTGSVTWKFEYVGAEGTTYGPSETKPTNAGTYVVRATLVSDTHAGSGTSDPFTISPKNMSTSKDITVELPENYEAVYDTNPKTPEVTVKDGDKTLVEGTDYTVTYDKNVNAGDSAVVKVTGQGNYTGEKTINFTITQAAMIGYTPTVVGEAKVGGVLTAQLDGVASSEYTWKWYYKTDTDPGHAEITAAEGKVSFVVTSDLSNKEIYAEAAAKGVNYTGTSLSSEPVRVAKQAITGTVVISAAGPIAKDTVLTANVDKIMPAEAKAGLTYQWYVDGVAVQGAANTTYTVLEADAEKSITVTVTATGDYDGSITSAAVEVGKTPLTGTVTLSQSDGKITATVTAPADSYDIVWLRDGQVISGATGTEYTVTDADKGHTISAKLVAKGDTYTGEVVAASGIDVPSTAPAAPTVTATAGNGEVTVSWTVSDNGGAPITGYTVICSVKDGAEVSRVTLGAATTSYTFTGLTNDITYTFTVTATNSANLTSTATKDAAPVEPTTPSVPSGGGGGGGVASYTNTVEKTENGTVTVSPKNASKGATVTLTVTPDEGYVLDTITVTDKNGNAIEVTKVSDGKYTFKMPGAPVTVKASFTEETVESKLPFTDVAENAWYYDAVAYVYENGMMTGTNDGTTFSPSMSLSRSMMAQVLYNLEKGTAPATGSFTDVAADAWYADAVNWAAANGIVGGYGNGKFGPEDSITREQMALILYNYANFKGYDMTATTDLTSFSDDEKVSDWAEYAMKWAVAEGLINGSNNALNPLGTASRAEVAQILMNFGQNVTK